MLPHFEHIKSLLDEKAELYEQPRFIEADPIVVPHRFTARADIEIAGFFAAILAWGTRASIINSANRILKLMDDSPHAFIVGHQDTDLKPFVHFVHRTFNATDLLYFIALLQHHFRRYDSLEQAFTGNGAGTAFEVLAGFHNYFFSLEHPARTRKHIATPARHSACKRLNMYLRWMVRSPAGGVDFGLWKTLQPAQLICPLDVHVAAVSRRLGLLDDVKSDWKNAVKLTEQLQLMNPDDPARYDFALFGLGAEERLK
jgi:uncharacterized protein (TIGR02757 family)